MFNFYHLIYLISNEYILFASGIGCIILLACIRGSIRRSGLIVRFLLSLLKSVRLICYIQPTKRIADYKEKNLSKMFLYSLFSWCLLSYLSCHGFVYISFYLFFFLIIFFNDNTCNILFIVWKFFSRSQISMKYLLLYFQKITINQSYLFSNCSIIIMVNISK